MGTLKDKIKQIEDNKYTESEKEKNYLSEIKDGLKTSINDINETLKPIEDFDQLLNLNNELPLYDDETENLINKDNQSNQKNYQTLSTLGRTESIIINNIPRRSDTNEHLKFKDYWKSVCSYCNDSQKCLNFCFICGCFFCIFQLIGVQEGIIILNALFNEIVDEIKLSRHIPKEYDFYQKIEIASYKSLPEIDVGMFWSFVGIMFLKKYGFIKSNIFQVLSCISLALLFTLFEFHEKDNLSIYYNRMQTTVLVISYIILCFLVGASSNIGIKQLHNLYIYFYQKHFDLYKILILYECKKRRKNER